MQLGLLKMLNPHQKAFNKFKTEIRRYWSHSTFTRQDSMLHTQQMVIRGFEKFMNEIIKKERSK